MPSPLQRVFNYQGNQVRTLIIDGKPWFVARDVCSILEIDHSQTRRLDDDEKGLRLIQTPGGSQEMTCVNEPGLYSLILGSRKPEAKAFKRWVTHEVLPAIRQTGTYISHNEQFIIPKTLPEALRLAADLAEKNYNLKAENSLMKPKAHLHDMFMSAKNLQPMGIVAKALGTGRNRLFDFLRERQVIMPDSPVPYQRYIEAGYFTVKEKAVMIGDEVVIRPQTFVTPRGVGFIARLMTTATYDAEEM